MVEKILRAVSSLPAPCPPSHALPPGELHLSPTPTPSSPTSELQLNRFFPSLDTFLSLKVPAFSPGPLVG